MLAADAGVAVAEVGSAHLPTAPIAEPGVGDAPVADGTSDVAASHQGAPAELIFVDSEVESASALTALAGRDAEVVFLHQHGDAIEQMTAAMEGHRQIRAVHVLSHGRAGALRLAGQEIDAAGISDRSELLGRWRASLAPGADILLYGCDAAAGLEGDALLRAWAHQTGADVAGSTDRTGHADRGGDWVLERQVGRVHAPTFAAADQLAAVDAVLPITIWAAGSRGEETMELQIDGQTVQSWTSVGGDAQAGEFQGFTYEGATGISADQVRVSFTNDLWEPDQGIDRNLRIDRIEIDGESFQTESADVFGTGTWSPVDGITPGFRESEWLHTNGYFQYAEPDTSGSRVTILAAGNENTETMELWIDGQLAQSWQDIGGDADGRVFDSFNFTAADTVLPGDVQIRFTNDLWEPDLGIDRNLRVDGILIDGVRYETEAPTVFSTGTWQDGEITPGFKQDETLHTNGYFQFGAELQPGVLSLETSNVVVDESAGEVRIGIRRTGGADGIVTVDYETLADTATADADFQATRGTLQLDDGQDYAEITIAILDDSLVESTEQFNLAIDNVSGGATLLAPRTATITITDDEVPLPNYADFTDVTGLTLNGAAVAQAGVVDLTADESDQAGSFFTDQLYSLANDGSFRTAFAFELLGGSDGADGLTFTIQNDPAGASVVGSEGGGLGYVGILNSVAVEFDTYRNTEWDVNDNHVSIISGDTASALRTASSSIDLNSGSRVYAWVDYNGVSDSLAVYVSDVATKPGEALFKTAIDLAAVIGDEARFGFTAGTGGLSNTHRLVSWSLDQQQPPLDPPTQPGGEVVGVNVVTGVSQPTAIDWLPDGTMLIARKSGVVLTADGGEVGATPFVDISDIVNDTRDRGLLDLAVHPEFADNPYVYLLFTYDPPEVFDQEAGTLAGPDGKGNRAGRLIRVTADPSTDFRTAIPGSEVVLLGTNSTWENFNGFANSTNDSDEPPAGENPDGSYVQDFINSDSESHTVGSLAFGKDGQDAVLFVSIGDGASYNRVDVRADRVQDVDSLSGKVLRIDPLTGEGLATNPFYNGDLDANRSKVYQLGLRNPFRITVDEATGELYVGDVGWTRWEEINSGAAGANYGWPYYEGASGTSVVNTRYRNTPEGDAFFAQNVTVDAPLYALSHQADGINAIVLGDVSRGGYYGDAFDGDLFFNDLGQGIVRHASLDADGQVVDVNTFTTGANVVVAMREGPDGAMYYVDLDDNLIGRWEIV